MTAAGSTTSNKLPGSAILAISPIDTISSHLSSNDADWVCSFSRGVVPRTTHRARFLDDGPHKTQGNGSPETNSIARFHAASFLASA